MKIIKRVLVTMALVVLAVILWELNVIYQPFVITDPDDPRFDARNFRYENYRETNDHFKRSIQKMFPPGTDKAYVDQILVKQGGAKTPTSNGLTKFHNPGDGDYTYIRGSWLVRFIFDRDGKAVMMKFGKTPMYGTDPIETFWEEKGYGRKQ